VQRTAPDVKNYSPHPVGPEGRAQRGLSGVILRCLKVADLRAGIRVFPADNPAVLRLTHYPALRVILKTQFALRPAHAQHPARGVVLIPRFPLRGPQTAQTARRIVVKAGHQEARATAAYQGLLAGAARLFNRPGGG